MILQALKNMQDPVIAESTAPEKLGENSPSMPAIIGYSCVGGGAILGVLHWSALINMATPVSIGLIGLGLIINILRRS
jgi:hypothetical protein